MATELSREQARLFRLRAQGLVSDGHPVTSVAQVVHNCCGLQAQDSRQAPLSIRARGRGLTVVDVEQARIEERSIVRTWCMRGTIHYVTVADLPRLLSLFGPLYVDRGQRRLTELGLDEDDCERAVSIIRDALADDGPLTRDELADRLLDEGLEFDPDGQAPAHIVRRACLKGMAVEAASRDGEKTYALINDWVSLNSTPNREDALAALARRYVAAYEPASLDDFYMWSGLYKRDVRTGWKAIKDELSEVDVSEERAWVITSSDVVDFADTPIVRLLPMYDSYFLGHQNRDLILPAEYADQVFPGGGLIRATVIVDGLAVGTWKLDRSHATPIITIEPFDSFSTVVEAEIESEVDAIGQFLDDDVDLKIL